MVNDVSIIMTLLFVAEAHSESKGGFGLNPDIFEANLINLAILIGVIFYYGRKVVGDILSERRSKIAQQIEEVEAQLKQSAQSLKEQQQKLEQAQVTAEKIRQDAQANAEKAKQTTLAQGVIEIERLRAVASQDLSSEQDRAIAELRQRAAALAIEKVESQLKNILDDSTQHQLIDRSIAQLGGGK
jgi:F-type H+-transporting ATPase subunit b